jgi:hypothetical protein
MQKSSRKADLAGCFMLVDHFIQSIDQSSLALDRQAWFVIIILALWQCQQHADELLQSGLICPVLHCLLCRQPEIGKHPIHRQISYNMLPSPNYTCRELGQARERPVVRSWKVHVHDHSSSTYQRTPNGHENIIEIIIMCSSSVLQCSFALIHPLWCFCELQMFFAQTFANLRFFPCYSQTPLHTFLNIYVMM